MRDMDYVITTRELAMLAKDENIDFTALEDKAYDDFMGLGSGAGVIFGNTGWRYGSCSTQCLHFCNEKKLLRQHYMI